MANHISRRQFLTTLAMTPIMASVGISEEPYTYSVKGKIAASVLGKSLIHEHVMVDFIAQYMRERLLETSTLEVAS